MGWLLDMVKAAQERETASPPPFDYEAFMDPDRPGLLPFQRRLRLLALEGYEIGEWGQAWRVPKRCLRPYPCGAKTRKGTPCRALPVPGKARCRFHGGLSTGPRTAAGRAAIAESNRRRSHASMTGQQSRRDTSCKPRGSRAGAG